MRAPTDRHVYSCPCGRRVVAIQGDGTWAAWEVFGVSADGAVSGTALRTRGAPVRLRADIDRIESALTVD